MTNMEAYSANRIVRISKLGIRDAVKFGRNLCIPRSDDEVIDVVT